MIRPILITFAAVVLTVVGAFAHGQVRHRWQFSQELQDRAVALENVPKEFGDWELREEKTISREVQQLLECTGYSLGTYANRSTGAVVTAFVVLGPAGPVAVHQPIVCYRNSNFQMGERKKIEIGQHTVGLMSMRKPDVTNDVMHVSYGWRPKDTWGVADSPRFKYAFYPYLYKFQTAAQGGVLPDGSEDTSITLSFLEEFLPALEQALHLEETPRD